MYRSSIVLLSALLVPALSGCISTGVRDVEVAPPTSLDTRVGSALRIEFPPGDVSITRSKDDSLHAAVTFFCNAERPTCRENAARAGIVHTQQGEHSTVTFEPSSAYTTRHADLRYEVLVPALAELDVQMGAGALSIDSPTGCLNVSTGAGDVSIRAPAADVGVASLDANLGDASLTTPDGKVFDQRKLLVGSEVLWEKGSGSCTLKAKVQAGALSVKLLAPDPGLPPVR